MGAHGEGGEIDNFAVFVGAGNFSRKGCVAWETSRGLFDRLGNVDDSGVRQKLQIIWSFQRLSSK